MSSPRGRLRLLLSPDVAGSARGNGASWMSWAQQDGFPQDVHRQQPMVLHVPVQRSSDVVTPFWLADPADQMAMESGEDDEYPLVRDNLVETRTAAYGLTTGESMEKGSSGQRQLGELSHPGMKFCIIEAVSRLPYRQMRLGSEQSERVARRFFAAGKFWTRKWTL